MYLFSTCTLVLFPAHDRLREFCTIAQSNIAPHIRQCIFRADESLINFKGEFFYRVYPLQASSPVCIAADRLNVALMNSAASSMRNFTSLVHLHADFLPTPCCRASGKDWIEQRPLLIARMFADLDDSRSILQNLTSLVIHLSAEEFMTYDAQWQTIPRPAK